MAHALFKAFFFAHTLHVSLSIFFLKQHNILHLKTKRQEEEDG